MYQHAQAGTFMRLLMIVAILILIVIGWMTLQVPQKSGTLSPQSHDELLRVLGLIFIFCFVLALFHNLTVTVDSQHVHLSYGIGIIRKKILLGEIAACKPVTNAWWWGMGIRMIPGGWMWNVAGIKAVELRLKNGRMFRIGTDEPEKLATTLQAGMTSR